MSHTAQPGAELGPSRVVPPLLDRLGDRHQHLLSNVIRIGFLHPLLPSQPHDDGPIDLNELMPSRLIRRIADADQQAGLCLGGGVHQCGPSLSFIHRRRRCLTSALIWCPESGE